MGTGWKWGKLCGPNDAGARTSARTASRARQEERPVDNKSDRRHGGIAMRSLWPSQPQIVQEAGPFAVRMQSFFPSNLSSHGVISLSAWPAFFSILQNSSPRARRLAPTGSGSLRPPVFRPDEPSMHQNGRTRIRHEPARPQLIPISTQYASSPRPCRMTRLGCPGHSTENLTKSHLSFGVPRVDLGRGR